MHRIFSSVSTSEPTPLNYPGFAASCGVSSLPPTLERLQLSNWTFTRLRDFKVPIGVSPKISAPTLWQFNWSQPIPPRSGGKYSPKTSSQNKHSVKPFHSFHLDLLGSAATQCPKVATNWSTCPFGPCCQVNPYLLKQSESWFYSWGSKLLCLASWHWACPPPFDFWLQVLFLHNSLEPQHFNISLHYLHTSLWYLNRPTLQPWRAASPRQQLLISDEDHTRLPDSCHILKDGHGFTFGCGWVCKTSCQPRGTISLRHIFVCAKENILWPPGRVVLHAI